MELQCGGASVVAAQQASAAGLIDELSLDAAPPLGDLLAPTAGASEAAVAARHVWCHAVGGAWQLGCPLADRARASTCAPSPGGVGVDLVSCQPTPDRRRAAAEHVGHVAHRQPARDDFRQKLTLDAAA
jgi:hypothetical protein